MKIQQLLALAVALSLTPPTIAQEGASPGKPARRPVVQMAILLDASSSMSGLIRQAKTQLWQVVNEFALAKQSGQPVELQLAFYEYGKNTLPASDSYVRQVSALTTNLDLVSKELQSIQSATRAGGDEYCGTVIQRAVDDLAWSQNNADLKVIFIAGNESFQQGPVDYRSACKAAISKGILVNTIHCGTQAKGISDGWAEGARISDGSYNFIDQNRRVANVVAPQDERIRKLNSALNSTYVPYGTRGQEGVRLQVEQDKAAASSRDATIIERSAAKSSSLYSNAAWDLVDAIERGTVKLEKLDEKALPAELRKLPANERASYLQAKSKRRAQIRRQIQTLYAERKKFVADANRALESRRSLSTTRSNLARPGSDATTGPKAARKQSKGSAQIAGKNKTRGTVKRPVDAESADPIAEAAGAPRQQQLGQAVIETLKKQAAKKKIEIQSPENDPPKAEDKKPEAGETKPESSGAAGGSKN